VPNGAHHMMPRQEKQKGDRVNVSGRMKQVISCQDRSRKGTEIDYRAKWGTSYDAEAGEAERGQG